MKDKIDFEQVLQMTRNGEFENKVPYPNTSFLKEGDVFDEEKSVRWNKEQVTIYNDGIKNQRKEYKRGETEAHKLFTNSLISAIMNDTGLSLEKAEIIYEKAYSDGHSGGYEDIISYAVELCDLLSKIK